MEKSNYYKEALKEVLNIIMITALIIMGLTGFYKIALALFILEILYFAIVPNNQSYRKYIDLRKGFITSSNGSFKKYNKQLFNLPLSVRDKCQNLEKKYNQIVEKVSKNNNLEFAYQDQINKMEFLLDKYISFSETFASYEEYLKDNDYNSVSKEIIETKNKIKHNYENVKDSNDLDTIHKKMESKTIMKSNLEILEKRLYKLKEIQNMSETLKIQMDNIEDSFHLVSDYLITSNNSELNFDVNQIIKDVELTESAIKDTQKEINKIKNVKIDYN